MHTTIYTGRQLKVPHQQRFLAISTVPTPFCRQAPRPFSGNLELGTLPKPIGALPGQCGWFLKQPPLWSGRWYPPSDYYEEEVGPGIVCCLIYTY
jgi:hypothetical protein